MLRQTTPLSLNSLSTWRGRCGQLDVDITEAVALGALVRRGCVHDGHPLDLAHDAPALTHVANDVSVIILAAPAHRL